METKKEYLVCITQYCTPIHIKAANKEDAEWEVINNHVWEVAEASIDIEEIQ